MQSKTRTTNDGAVVTTTYQYSSDGRLQNVVTPGKNIEYKHNALGNRVAKLINGTIAEKYLWQNKTTLLATYDANNNLKQRFEYTLGHAPTAFTQNGSKYYILTDQLGTPRLVTDSSGNVVKQISYDSYGNVIEDSAPEFTLPFGFAGGLYDADTGLIRFGYRDYDPEAGRWTARDPIGFEGGDSNLYGYVLGDPVNFVDPDGLRGLRRGSPSSGMGGSFGQLGPGNACVIRRSGSANPLHSSPAIPALPRNVPKTPPSLPDPGSVLEPSQCSSPSRTADILMKLLDLAESHSEYTEKLSELDRLLQKLESKKVYRGK